MREIIELYTYLLKDLWWYSIMHISISHFLIQTTYNSIHIYNKKECVFVYVSGKHNLRKIKAQAWNFGSSFRIFLNSWFLASWINVNKKVQLDATVCRHLFTAKSLYMFWVSQHPSSGALKTVTATSGIGHNTGTATSFQRGLIRPRWKEADVPVLWPIPEVAVTVFSATDDGCCDARNM